MSEFDDRERDENSDEEEQHDSWDGEEANEQPKPALARRLAPRQATVVKQQPPSDTTSSTGTGRTPAKKSSGASKGRKRSAAGAGSGADDERRAKTRRACLSCQRAHLTCDDKRPCTRCAKRGLSDSCTDGYRKKAKYLADLDDEELLQGSPARHPIIKAPTTSPPLAQPQPKPMISNLLGQPDFPLAPGTVPTAANPASIFSSDSINLEYAMLSNMLSQQGFQLPATGGTSAPTLAAPAPIPAVARTSGSTPNLTRPPSTAPQALAAYQQITKPYDYRQGFHYLVHHIKSRMAKPDIMRICRALAHFRPSFMAQIMNLSEEDLVFMEKCFQRTLVEYEKLINCSGTPTVVWRRTGEVALVGKEFSLLTGWSREQLLGKKTYIYELMDTESAVDYWEKFSLIAFDNSQTSVMTTCTLVSPEGRNVPCAFCFTIKRDIFDVPLAIVGAFLPSFNQMSS